MAVHVIVTDISFVDVVAAAVVVAVDVFVVIMVVRYDWQGVVVSLSTNKSSHVPCCRWGWKRRQTHHNEQRWNVTEVEPGDKEVSKKVISQLTIDITFHSLFRNDSIYQHMQSYSFVILMSILGMLAVYAH